MTRTVLGVDASTTAIKAIAFDADGMPVATGRSSLHRQSPHPGWAEQSAEEWWQGLVVAIRDVTEQLQSMGADMPEAVCITHQRETFVCLDGGGQQVRPAILWLDTRAKAQIEEFGNAAVHAASGKPPSTTPSLYKLIWLRENEPDALERTAMVLDVGGYLAYRLTGEYVTSTASADPLSLLDMAAFDWSPHLLGLTGLSASRFPRLVPPGQVMATVDSGASASTGLPVGTPVVAGAGDGQAAGLGAAVLDDERAYLSLGTSITLGLHSDAFRTSMSYRTLASPLAGSYTLEGLLASGALSLEWVRRVIATLPDTPEGNAALSAMAESSPPGSKGLLFLPYLTSAETPYWDADARGAFVGLGDYHTTADLVRATFEGLALEVRLLLELILADTGTNPGRLIVMGGAAKSSTFLQILADVLERDIEVSSEDETAALGAGILAGFAADLHGTSNLAATAARMTRTSAALRPGPGVSATYAKLFAVYRTLYPQLKSVFPSLRSFREDGGAGAHA
jgi:xylulokinase